MNLDKRGRKLLALMLTTGRCLEICRIHPYFSDEQSPYCPLYALCYVKFRRKFCYQFYLKESNELVQLALEFMKNNDISEHDIFEYMFE